LKKSCGLAWNQNLRFSDRLLKAKAYAHIYKETEIFVGAVEATRTYVKDVLRP